MKRIRIGNDINISLRVLTAGEARPLEGRNLRLVLRDPKGGESEVDFSVVGNTMGFVFLGSEQKHIGRYGVELWENEGKALQAVTDVSEAFVLVQRSDEQGGNDTADLRTESIELSLELDDAQACLAALFASGKVDDSLDDDKLVLQRGNTVYTTTVAALQGALKERINEVEQGLTNTQGTIDSAIKSSKSYTDIKASQAVEEAKDYTDKKVLDVANGQLKLSVKDNGNVVLSNANGESKEFMPATPSGDPMHYLYESAGAVYNDSDEDVVKKGVYGDVVHKSHHWYLNDLGDITNEQMCDIYRYTNHKTRTQNLAYAFVKLQIRTNIPIWTNDSAGGSFGPDGSFSLYCAAYGSTCETFALRTNNTIDNGEKWLYKYEGLTAAFHRSKIKKIIGVLRIDKNTAIADRFLGTDIEEVRLYELKSNITIDSVSLSYESIMYMITNRSSTNDIVIALKSEALSNAETAYLADSSQDHATYPTLADFALSKHVNIATV